MNSSRSDVIAMRSWVVRSLSQYQETVPCIVREDSPLELLPPNVADIEFQPEASNGYRRELPKESSKYGIVPTKGLVILGDLHLISALKRKR